MSFYLWFMQWKFNENIILGNPADSLLIHEIDNALIHETDNPPRRGDVIALDTQGSIPHAASCFEKSEQIFGDGK